MAINNDVTTQGPLDISRCGGVFLAFDKTMGRSRTTKAELIKAKPWRVNGRRKFRFFSDGRGRQTAATTPRSQTAEVSTPATRVTHSPISQQRQETKCACASNRSALERLESWAAHAIHDIIAWRAGGRAGEREAIVRCDSRKWILGAHLAASRNRIHSHHRVHVHSAPNAGRELVGTGNTPSAFFELATMRGIIGRKCAAEGGALRRHAPQRPFFAAERTFQPRAAAQSGGGRSMKP